MYYVGCYHEGASSYALTRNRKFLDVSRLLQPIKRYTQTQLLNGANIISHLGPLKIKQHYLCQTRFTGVSSSERIMSKKLKFVTIGNAMKKQMRTYNDAESVFSK